MRGVDAVVIAGFSLMTMLLILLAGIGAGFVGYAVGASSLVSYPALLALGIPPVPRQREQYRRRDRHRRRRRAGRPQGLRGQRLRSITYVSIGAVGGVAGAALLLSLDPKIFEFAVPPLILFSSLIVAVNPRALHAGAAGRGGRHGFRPDPDDAARAGGATARPRRSPSTQPMSRAHGGYGSASRSWRYTADISVPVPARARSRCSTQAKIGPFHQINALKTLIGTGANISASVIFIVRGVVDWPVAILLCIGCFIGGYIASPVTRRILPGSCASRLCSPASYSPLIWR